MKYTIKTFKALLAPGRRGAVDGDFASEDRIMLSRDNYNNNRVLAHHGRHAYGLPGTMSYPVFMLLASIGTALLNARIAWNANEAHQESWCLVFTGFTVTNIVCAICTGAVR
jgi:hypothetical protein